MTVDSFIADSRLIKLAQDRRSQIPVCWPKTFPYYNDNFMPLLPGDYVTLIAASGEGKSSFARWLGRHFATIAEVSSDEHVLYASSEESLEKVHASLAVNPYPFRDIVRGKANIEDIRRIAADNFGLRVKYLGPSFYSKPEEPKEISFDIVKRELLGGQYSVCVLDYLQAFKPYVGYKGERLQSVMDTSIAVRDFVKYEYRKPFIALCQSNKEVKNNQRKVPGLYDAQWSSQIGQDSDINLGFWNISRDISLGTMVKLNIKNIEYTVPVLKGMGVLTVNKWRDCEEAVGVSILVGTHHKHNHGEIYELDEEWAASLQEDEVKRYIKMGYININDFQVLHKKWEAKN